MRIFILWDYYSHYLNWFESNNPNISELTYKQHIELLLNDYYGTTVSIRDNLCLIGHDCEIFVGNYYNLQQKWLNENDEKLNANPETKFEIVLKQIESFKPDVFYLSSMFDYYGSFLEKVSKITPNIFGWISCPYNPNLNFNNIKSIITSSENFVEQFHNLGLNAVRLRPAFDKMIAEKVSDIKKTVDVSFIGGLSARTHKFRIKLLEKLVKSGVNLKVWGYGLEKKKFGIFGNPLESCYQGEVWGMDMYRALASSRISLNFHIDVIKGKREVGNMRMYEATGCGSMLLTDTGYNIRELFVPKKEIETYESYDEIIEKVLYYIQHNDEAESIAKAGQSACLERHSWEKRVVELESIFLKYSD
ncbi:MAG: glycosyltransferase [Bacteroidota bacterium]